MPRTDPRSRADALAELLDELEAEGLRVAEARREPLRVRYRQARAELRVLQAELPACRTCGQPVGACYMQCPESPHFYSPEQERADDPWYGSDANDGLVMDALADAAGDAAAWEDEQRWDAEFARREAAAERAAEAAKWEARS